MQPSGGLPAMPVKRSRDRAAVSMVLVTLVIQLAAAPSAAAADPLPQTIAFSLPASGVVRSSVALVATSDSGLPVAYASDTTDVCAIADATLTLVTAGTCTVTATQPGDDTYAAADPVRASMTVEAVPPDPLPQAITFSLPASGVVGSTVVLTATADSALSVDYATTTPEVCTVEVATLSLVAPGTCSVTASQPGDATYAAADPVRASLTVEALPPDPLTQVITFSLPASGVVGSNVILSATSDSTLPVEYATNTPDVCSITDTTLSLVVAGACTVTASQPGDDTYAAATDVVAAMAVLLPQAITFSLPASGVVGGTVPLGATASSGLPVAYAVTTPIVCTITGMTLHLNADGPCTVTTSQPGDATYGAAPEVTDAILIKLPPLTTPGGTSLGRYAFNGPIRAMAVDPATGIAYVGGDFTQVGIRTGSVAVVDPPGSGSDRLRGSSPDVIGGGVTAFADDATGYFLFGGIESIRGAGVPWWAGVRMTADGNVDPSWHMTMPCTITIGTPSWDIGDKLVAGIPASLDASGLSTVGLVFVDKETGHAVLLGGGSACGLPSARLWPSIEPFAPLAACLGWTECGGRVSDVVVDEATQTLVVEMSVTSRRTADSVPMIRHFLVGYDMVAGTRLWSIPLEHADSGQLVGGQTSKMVGLGGAVLAAGWFPLELDRSTESTMVLVDAATGAILQRWNAQGEQDLASPSTIVAPAAPCTPADNGRWNDVDYEFTRTSASSAVGYGSATDVPGGRAVAVCSYGLAGSGSATRLTAARVGTLEAHPDPELAYRLPSTLYEGRYLVGGYDAFDLQTGSQVAGWHPSPSAAPRSTIVVGSSIVFAGEFTFVHGAPANHVAALDRDLAPIPGFVSGLVDQESNGWRPDVRALGFADGRVIAVGHLQGDFGQGPVVALDAATGAVDWADAHPASPMESTNGLSLAVDPGTDAFYVGIERFGLGVDVGDALARYVPTGSGFAVDPTFSHAFGAIDSGPRPSITGLGVIAGRLYVGGSFASIDGLPRQALARFGAGGSLDAWAPSLIDEMTSSDGTIWGDFGPRSFVEAGDKVVVTGIFPSYPPLGVGAPVPPAPGPQTSDVLVYSSETGTRVRPLGSNDAWFCLSSGYDSCHGAYDMALIDDTIYVALGVNGIAAFDSTTFDYLPNRSIRTQGGWGSSAIYALAARPPETGVASWNATGGARIQATSADPASTIVLGGSLARWKNDTAGNVVELTPQSAIPEYILAVALAGSGTGTVTSTSGAIGCGSTCTASIASGSSVQLSASPAVGSSFDGWSGGGCSGTGSCTVTVSGPTTVTATFTETIVDTILPTAAAPTATIRAGVPLSGSSIPVRLTWTGADTGGSGIARYEFAKSTNGGTTWTTVSAALTSASANLTVTSSGTARFRVRAVDGAGNVGVWATGPILTPRLTQQLSTAVNYHGTWTKTSSSNFSGGSARYAHATGAYLTFAFTGRSIALVTTTAANRGKVKVYVNGVYQATVDLRSSATTYRVLAWQKTWSTSATRTVKLVVVGTSGRPRVDLDAFATLK